MEENPPKFRLPQSLLESQNRKGESWKLLNSSQAVQRPVSAPKKVQSVRWIDNQNQGPIDGQVTHIVNVTDRLYELTAELIIDAPKHHRWIQFRKQHHSEAKLNTDILVNNIASPSFSPISLARIWSSEYEAQQLHFMQNTEFDKEDPATDNEVALDSMRLKMVNSKVKVKEHAGLSELFGCFQQMINHQENMQDEEELCNTACADSHLPGLGEMKDLSSALPHTRSPRPSPISFDPCRVCDEDEDEDEDQYFKVPIIKIAASAARSNVPLGAISKPKPIRRRVFSHQHQHQHQL